MHTSSISGARWLASRPFTAAMLSMPVQDLSQAPSKRRLEASFDELFRTRLSRLLLGALTLGPTMLFVDGLYRALALQNGATVLHFLFLLLASLAFMWMAFGAANALIGAYAILRGRYVDTIAVPAQSHGSGKTNSGQDNGPTALLFPIYQEDPEDIAGTIRKLAIQLRARGENERYHIFVLSDSQSEEARRTESRVILQLISELGPEFAIFYRNRQINKEKKAGNVADWVRNFGGAYPYFIVFDADSEMHPDTLDALVRSMDHHPDTGLIQTVPRLNDSNTVFGQMQAFANNVFGPISAAGFATWQGASGNYWGHNAIIRTAAFAESAGLPHIAGRAPFGGPIRSHDFVEAALMRRAGWRIALVTRMTGSCEASPPTLVDMAVRDRRWMQGNLQHIAVVPATGLAPISRGHMMIGILSYVASSVWLAMLLVGMALVAHEHGREIAYFNERSLFPQWPTFDPDAGLNVLLGTLLIVFLPKLLGLVIALRDIALDGADKISRAPALIVGWAYELLVSSLMAPVFMLLHVRYLAEVFLGMDSGWNPQNRRRDGIPFMQALRFHAVHVLVGVVLFGVSIYIDRAVALWLSPIIAGLLLAPVLTWFTSRPKTDLEATILTPYRAPKV